MKTYVLILSLCFSSVAKSQIGDTTAPTVAPHTVKSTSHVSASPLVSAKYGTLLYDDPTYTRKYSWYIPSARVLSSNVFNWALAKYAYKFDWPATSTSDWKNNFKKGPHWDVDGFGTNFIGHPHTGSYYFNAARANGYSFWGSAPFALQGSLTWEYLGENEQPSYNDLINTPLSGMFLGEVFYRVSSNILDDRTRGGQRVVRELLAGVINPTRALNRLTQGKMFRVTSKEVYQKEPMNITFSAGVHKVNNKIGKDNLFATGATNALLNMQLDYGDPFESRKRKPFDLFRFRTEMSYGADTNLLDNVIGYGILTGRNLKEGRLLGGIFQHFDYWRTSIFEVASLGFGGSLISGRPLSRNATLYSGLHLAVVPLAGNSTQFGPSNSDVRQYNFGGGMQAKLEETLHINDWATLGLAGYSYFIHTYKGIKGNSLVNILRPSLTIKMFRNLRVGFEHHFYNNERFLKDAPNVSIRRTEQKLFLQLLFEDARRTGRYQ
ncbi:MAG TPA: DUF3943 domain-containing protein [Chitinophagaceae bacterium]|nr:DUF3943 domain-containing protein [Chitinophagaceae bacterium]